MQMTMSSPALKNSVRAFTGTRLQFEVSAEETNNALAIIEMQMLASAEFPRHVHDHEDELYILKEGEITFFIGDDIIQAKPGSKIFLPRHVPHHFKITTDKAVATLVVTPGNFQNFYKSISAPYKLNDAPPVDRGLTDEEITHFITMANRYGVHFV